MYLDTLHWREAWEMCNCFEISSLELGELPDHDVGMAWMRCERISRFMVLFIFRSDTHSHRMGREEDLC